MAKRRGSKKRKILFVIELIVLLLFIGGLYVYGQINSKLNKLDYEEDTSSTESVQINQDVVDSTSLTGYNNIALFGVDSREDNLDYANSDCMIVASINNDAKEVKLASVYRDTLLDIGDDSYQKCNAAYAVGGPQQAMSMLNQNLDLNITQYVSVDFSALAEVVDQLGGLDIEMTGAEVVHMNNYCVETSKVTGKEYTRIEEPADDYVDTYHLNGVQSVSYARIRYTAGNDFKRTERQREVIKLIVEKAKKSSIKTLFSIMDTVFPMIKTNVSKEEILTLGASMLGYSIGETTGFPYNHTELDVPKKGDCVVPDNLATDVVQLHQFLFNDGAYTVSSEVQNRSDTITKLAGGEVISSPTPTGTLQESGSSTSSWTNSATDYYEDDTSDDSYESYDNSYSDNSYSDNSYNDYSDGGFDGGYSDSGYSDNSDSDSGGGFDSSYGGDSNE